jgi:hypothetical protein
MFRKNQRHLQSALLSDLDLLTVKQRKRLQQSWAGTFRREVFCRLDESPFAVLYADAPSRPNIPVNVLVGLETLKAGQGWSDEEMHDEFSFGLQVRYALGYENLGDGEFDLRTLYNFRHRLNDHMCRTGENLVDQAFRQITDAQVEAFQLKTGRLRMDTTQIASNIRRMSRVHLLVEVLHRAHRMLNPADQAHYAEAFAPYLQGSSGQYVYHLKGAETSPHLQRIGELMHRLLVELAPTYGANDTYQMLQRVFREQFTLNEETPQAKSDDAAGGPPPELLSDSDLVAAPDDPAEISAVSTQPTAATPITGVSLPPEATTSIGATSATPDPAAELAAAPPDPAAQPGTPPMTLTLQPKPGKEICANGLLSPDDPEATFRRKGNQTYQGYVTNVTETCDPENPFQLIVQVQTASNTTEDATLLRDALPDLKTRTGVETLYNDATFCSPAADKVLREQHVTQVPSDLRGQAPNPARLGLADFNVESNGDGVPQQITCPQGQGLPVTPGRQPQWYVARFDAGVCQACPLPARCPSQLSHSNAWRVLRFSQTQLDVAQRRQRSAAYHQAGKNLRAAVEATIGALKRPFSDDQLPVRGRYRVGVLMIGSALMVNVRRIQRYLVERDEQQQQTQVAEAKKLCPSSSSSFLSALWTRFLDHLRPTTSRPSAVQFGY